MNCSDISKVIKCKKDAVQFLQDDCNLYIHPPNLSNRYYLKAVFDGSIKVSFLSNLIRLTLFEFQYN